MTAGGVHLIGGGWGGDGAAWRGFLEAAAASSDGPPRIGVVTVREAGEHGRHAAQLVQALQASGPFEPEVAVVGVGADLPDGFLDLPLDGLLVGGGVTPAYLDVLAPHAERIRALVGEGLEYAGFSAGSAVAAERALVGGWLHDGLPVLAEDAGEGLQDLAVRDGLGLVPFTVDVHAAQWGTLARLVTAVEQRLVPRGVAIDEDTALVVHGGEAHVEGAGNAWWASLADEGVLVRRETGAGDPRTPGPLRGGAR